ncbi:MAG TPA: hypothetical protein VF510_17780 [Ktedonobacterales bacterium]
MQHLTSLWISLHKRGIQAILVAGCLLGFGFGQALGATYGPHANRAFHVPIGGVGALVGANRASSGLGNAVGGQQGTGAQKQRPAVSHATPAQRTSSGTATQAPTTSSSAATQSSSSNGHQADKDGSHGNGKGKEKGHDGKKSPKTKGHRTGNDGGADTKQGKDGGKHEKGGHGHHGG